MAEEFEPMDVKTSLLVKLCKIALAADQFSGKTSGLRALLADPEVSEAITYLRKFGMLPN
jgi:hypothetical protein